MVFDRGAELGDHVADGVIVGLEKIDHLLGRGRLRERGETTEIAGDHRKVFAAPPRNAYQALLAYQARHPRREKELLACHATDEVERSPCVIDTTEGDTGQHTGSGDH